MICDVHIGSQVRIRIFFPSGSQIRIRNTGPNRIPVDFGPLGIQIQVEIFTDKKDIKFRNLLFAGFLFQGMDASSVAWTSFMED
jgi:hypothetical protein